MRLIIVILLVIYALNCHSAEIDFPEFRYLNENVDPCDDFYEFTCGNFKKFHPLPVGEQIWDQFTILQQEIHNLAKEILESPRSSSEPRALQKAKGFYQACRQVSYIDTLPQSQISVVQKYQWPAISANYKSNQLKLTWNELAAITSEYGLPFFLNFQTIPALFIATSNAIQIDTDSLENPEASGIRPELPRGIPEITAKSGTENIYLDFLKNIAFRLRDLTHEYTPDAKIIDELEETILFRKIVENGGIVDNQTIPNLPVETSIKVLQNWTNTIFGDDFLDWVSYLNVVLEPTEVRITPDTMVLIINGTSLYGILNLYRISSDRELRNYVMATLLTHMAPDSDSFMREQWKTFTIQNKGTVYPRDDYCVRKTLGYKGSIDFSLAVTYEYQKYHFDINKLEKAATMVQDLHSTFVEMLDNSIWLDAESKEKAKQKAYKMITLLGYPEEAENDSELNDYYKSMNICAWDHFGNSQRLRAFSLGESLKEIGNPKMRDVWNLSPLEVNSFYNRGNNRILLPVSILNPVFFNGDYSVIDYGRIGAVIGHEVTHGFDSTGQMYNSEGILQGGWWSQNSTKAFNEKVECFKQQYSEYYIKEIDSYVDGVKTLNENLADNGGLRAAYQAFQKVQPEFQNFRNYTLEQMFFIGYGTMWCVEESNDYLEAMNQNGAYSPGRFRVQGAVSNMNEFSNAFQCPSGSKMNPVDKCVLW